MNLSQKLGYSEDTKLLIIHADDAGLAHSQNKAIVHSIKTGIVSSYSIMVPCPWFYEIAVFAIKNPQFDGGLHLTLTCEWENYKFGPVLPISEVPSLVDDHGYFYKTREDLRKNASSEDVRKELTAQIEKALTFGLVPTHLDSHMYSVGACAEFFEIYRELGKKYKLPVLINPELMRMVGLDPDPNIFEGDLITDKVHLATFEHFETGRLSHYYAGLFENFGCGLNVVLIHPAFDDMEMKGITINHPNFGSEWRQIDFDCFTSQEIMVKLKESEAKLITWKDIQNAVAKGNDQ